jgi:hypothetical protein
MIAVRRRPQASLDVVARRRFAAPILASSLAAFLLAVAAPLLAWAQASGDTIYGVTALDVAPDAAAQARQYGSYAAPGGGLAQSLRHL